MDWGIVGQVTFFVGVALLAVVVTVFVLAISMLGLAIKVEAEERAKRQEEQKQATEKRFKLAREALEKAHQEHNEGRITNLSESVRTLKKQLKKNEKDIKDIAAKYITPFTVKGGILWPGLCFLPPAVVGGIAWSLPETSYVFYVGGFYVGWLYIGESYFSIAHLLAISWAGIAYGICRLYASLRAIQEVSIVSEEAALSRQVEAAIVAHEEVEAASKPVLELVFQEPKPPFSVVMGEKLAIEFRVHLAKGEIARDVIATFIAPEGFDLIGGDEDFDLPKDNPIYPGCCATECHVERLLPGTSPHRKLIIKAPPKTGTNTLAYRTECPRFTSEFTECEVKVIPKAQDSAKA